MANNRDYQPNPIPEPEHIDAVRNYSNRVYSYSFQFFSHTIIIQANSLIDAKNALNTICPQILYKRKI